MDRELADFYKLKLRQYRHEKVGLRTDQAIAVIGVARLQEICDFAATIINDMQTGRKKPRSLIPPHKRYKREGFVMVDRIAFLKAIEDAEDELIRRSFRTPSESSGRPSPSDFRQT